MFSSCLRDYDVLRVTRRLDARVVNILKAYPGEVFLTGGFIRAVIAGEPVNDVDLVVKDIHVAGVVAGQLQGDSKERVVSTENAYTLTRYRPVVQVITRWVYDTPAAALNEFDFTVACAAVWYEGGAWRSLCHDHYYADLAAKRLVYLAPQRHEDAGGSMLRLLKFYRRGYTAPLSTVAAVMTRTFAGVKPHARIEWADGDLGDEIIAKYVTGLLHEVDPNIDPDHIVHEPGPPAEGA
jgi:hypothetical protein